MHCDVLLVRILSFFQLNIVRGSGKFVETPAFSPHVYCLVNHRNKTNVPEKVERTEYSDSLNRGSQGATPEVIVAKQKSDLHAAVPDPRDDGFHGRPMTKAGNRNMLDSSFSLSGEQAHSWVFTFC